MNKHSAEAFKLVSCPECGDKVKAKGLGTHRRLKHGYKPATRPPSRDPAYRRAKSARLCSRETFSRRVSEASSRREQPRMRFAATTPASKLDAAISNFVKSITDIVEAAAKDAMDRALAAAMDGAALKLALPNFTSIATTTGTAKIPARRAKAPLAAAPVSAPAERGDYNGKSCSHGAPSPCAPAERGGYNGKSCSHGAPPPCAHPGCSHGAPPPCAPAERGGYNENDESDKLNKLSDQQLRDRIGIAKARNDSITVRRCIAILRRREVAANTISTQSKED